MYPSIVNENGSFQTADLDDFRSYLRGNNVLYLDILLSEEKKLLIDLKLNNNLFNKSSFDNLNAYSCHFQGRIQNVSNSFVAISVCNGIVIFFLALDDLVIVGFRQILVLTIFYF